MPKNEKSLTLSSKSSLLTRFILCSVFLCLFSPFKAYAQEAEYIAEFNSHIMVNRDASIDVAEEISVYALGEVIKRGIVRWLPTDYTDSYGIRRSPDYRITQVLLDNHTSPYHLKYSDGKMAIYVGSEDVFLQPGNYTYTIQYHVDDAINFLKDGDELYWNVTGNNWVLPILKASAIVSLPDGAVISSYHGYTGATGEKGTQYKAHPIADNTIEFSTGMIAPGSGFTIAVAWPKGIVHAPTLKERILRSIKYNRAQYIVFEIALLVFFYYLLVWYWYGRDPERGTIIPLFAPPANLSPAAVRYISRMGFDMKTFTSAIVGLATKNALTVVDDNDDFKLEKKPQPLSLAPEEQALYQELFSKQSTVVLSKGNSAKLQEAKSELTVALTERFEPLYFITNTNYLLPGIILTLLAFAVTIFSANDVGAAAFSVLWLTIWTGVCSMLLIGAYDSIRALFSYFSLKLLWAALGSLFFAIPFLIGEVVGLVFLAFNIPIFSVPLLFFISILNVIYYHLMKQPTPAGRKVMDQIEGFKLFLSTTERFRLNQMHSPTLTPELFEQCLPYAIALDVEYIWGQRFNEALADAGIDPNRYHPTWYQGRPFTASTLAGFPAALGSSMGSSLTATSISSSASGGGGSSGGGGGGGGGGGW